MLCAIYQLPRLPFPQALPPYTTTQRTESFGELHRTRAAGARLACSSGRSRNRFLKLAEIENERREQSPVKEAFSLAALTCIIAGCMFLLLPDAESRRLR